MNYTIDLWAEREKLTGTAAMSMGKGSSESILTKGSMKGDDISFVEILKVQGQELRCEHNGKISGDEIRGSRTVVSYGNEEFVAKHAKQFSLIVPAHVPEMPVEARLAHRIPGADRTILGRS